MKLLKLLPTCFLALGLSLSIAACDDGDDGETTDTNANDSTTANNEDETTAEGGMDVECSTFCTNYVDLCAQTGKSTEFELNDDCLAACEAWDQAGINCRNEQIIADACDQAGNMGSTC